jgi:hypothetical protein
METKANLGAKAIGRRELENNERYELKKPQSPYHRVFDPEKCSLRLKNNFHCQVINTGGICSARASFLLQNRSSLYS